MGTIRLCSILVSITVAAAFMSTAACATVEDAAAKANDAYQAEDWPEARKYYDIIVKDAPQNGRAWYRLAVARRYTGDTDGALEALDQSESVGVPKSFTDFERAKVYSRLDDPDKSLAALESAVAAGFSQPESLEGNKELAAILDAPQFAGIVDGARLNKFPCRGDNAFRHFDFWVGNWEVHDAQGVLQGNNKIAPAEGGCYLTENWTGATGSTGSSINFYDVASDEWVQQWISAGGTQIHIRGGLEGESMMLTGKIYYLKTAQGADFRGRWTPLEDGRVRQFFEQSNDDGKTWNPWFEAFYSKTP